MLQITLILTFIIGPILPPEDTGPILLPIDKFPVILSIGRDELPKPMELIVLELPIISISSLHRQHSLHFGRCFEEALVFGGWGLLDTEAIGVAIMKSALVAVGIILHFEDTVALGVPVLHLALVEAVLGEEEESASAYGRSIPESTDEIISVFEDEDPLPVEFMSLSQ